MRLVIVAAILAAFCVSVQAHGPAEWIQEGHYKNAAGELCCGVRDCGEKIAGTIEQTPDGYIVDATFRITTPQGVVIDERVKEFVPNADATPSPDGSYWRCRWGGARKCFFFPPPNS